MQIVLDGQEWRTEADFIDAVLAGVKAPSWHGRNYNALRDSFLGGSINGIEPPYDFIVRMPSIPTDELADAVRYFIDSVTEWCAEGARISARMDDLGTPSLSEPIPHPHQT